MKKRILLLLILIFLLGTIVGRSQGYSSNITAWFYDMKINLNGSALNFTNSPFVYNGRTYVSISELSRHLGLEVQWIDSTKTINLTSSANNDLAVNTLKYELDRKNLELHNLKLQLQQKDQQLAILRDTSFNNSADTDSTLDELEEYLEDNFDRHRNNSRLMSFTYALRQLSNGDIEVEMKGDFTRTSSYWNDRDEEDFEDFIIDIFKEIDREFNEDIELYVYDQNNATCANYEYSDSNNAITYTYEY